jgi:ABC-type multidrug transport system permease subunit
LLAIDFDTDRKIDFEMTLPWPLYMVVLKNVMRIAFVTFLRILPLPFVSKLLVYQQFSFAHISPLSVLIILPLATVMISVSMLCGAHAVQSRFFMDFRLRIVDQMFFLGCFMFPWAIMYKALPGGAYLSLLNPVVHMMEATRTAFFGQEGFLPFGISCTVLIIEATLFFFLSIYLFKRRLDTILT